ncbi:MAG: hypothetical protein HOI95_18190 [Chromatiales bacterium]|jgi:aspartate-semialdehyde dehydrogenase|nr:hypothetical protein [Chromatiales bacterium]
MNTFAAPHVAIVGATGAVATTMLSVLQDRSFPLASLRLFAASNAVEIAEWLLH